MITMVPTPPAVSTTKARQHSVAAFSEQYLKS